MLKSESAVEIRLEKHLSRRGQLVIYGYCQVTSNLGVLPRGHQLMLSLVYLISCCSPNFQLRDWSVQSRPSALVCALISPQALCLSYSMFIVSKRSNIFLAKNEVICWLEILIFFAILPSAPLPLLTKASAAAARWCRFFTWLYDFVRMIKIAKENFCHRELVTLKVTMFLCHLYPPKGDYSFGRVIFKNTVKKNYFRYSWLYSYPHRCSNDDHSCQAAQNWAHPDTPGTQSYVLSSIHNISGLKKDIYVIISDIDHLLLLLTVAFAETIPLLSVSMSSRSSIVLPSLDWLLPKELSLHVLSRVIKLDQFSRPCATSLHRKYLSNTLTPIESYRKMKRCQPTALFHLSTFTFYFQEPGPSSLHWNSLQLFLPASQYSWAWGLDKS